jgi:hypothetical protein
MLSGNIATLYDTRKDDAGIGTAIPPPYTCNSVLQTSSTQASKWNMQQIAYCAVDQFLNDYRKELTKAGESDASGWIEGVPEPQSDGDCSITCRPQTLYKELSDLRHELLNIDKSAGDAFHALNHWYDRSSVVFVDLLTPSTTNAEYRVGITAAPTYVPFTLTTPSSGGGSSTTQASAVTAPAAGHIDTSSLFFVHRLANFNLIGGFLTVRVPTKTYALIPSTVTVPSSGTVFSPCGPGSSVTSTATSYYCPTVTQSTDWQVSAMAALNWFPWGRDYYPGQRVRTRAETFRDMFGVMLGTAVTTLGTGFGGVNFEPVNGLSFYSGVASANSQRLPTGVNLSTPFNSTSNFQPVTTLHAGLAFGIGFDFGVASSIFRFSAPSTF